MNCPLEPDGDHWHCPTCGRRVHKTSDKPPRANCWSTADKSRGLGDTIAKIITAIGIKPCGGCKKRQALLNRLVPYQP